MILIPFAAMRLIEEYLLGEELWLHIQIQKKEANDIRKALVDKNLLENRFKILIKSENALLPLKFPALLENMTDLSITSFLDFSPVSFTSCAPMIDDTRLTPFERMFRTLQKANFCKGKSKLPRKWEILGGDVILFPDGAFDWIAEENLPTLGELLSNVFRVSRVGIQKSIGDCVLRKSQAHLIFDQFDRKGWVKHRENGVLYGFDFTEVMFASGNASEKIRIANLCQPGEVLCDLYAGMGDIPLPVLKYSRVAHVHCCEWNTHAVKAMRWSLKHSKSDPNRYTVHAGDNRETSASFPNSCDRVTLGLLPTSEPGYKPALCVLKPQGGTLHVHENVPRLEVESFQERLLETLRQYAVEVGKSFTFSVKHVEKVKSYCPRNFHIVFDISCTPN